MKESEGRNANAKASDIRKSHLPEESRRLSSSGEEQEQADIPPPPDGGYGWVIVFASFFCNMVVDGITYTFGVFLIQFANFYDEKIGKVAWVGSLLTGMCFIAGPVVGGLSNKYGCRIVSIAGSILASSAFVLSTFAPNVAILMVTYGVMGGIGFGFIYLPAVVCVGYYFETKRSLATGIAVCGSGFGTFAFAPFANFLIKNFTWQQANLILAAVILSCALFGATMRPLTYPKPSKNKSLLMRMAEDKKNQLQRGSIEGSYFIVQMSDGTLQKVRKVPPINIDPGVHSALCLDQLTPATPQGLPTITESKTPHSSTSNMSGKNDNRFNFDINHEKLPPVPQVTTQPDMAKRKLEMDNGSAPLLNTAGRESTELLDDVFTTSRISVRVSKDQLRPLAKKDVFYSGSVQNLKEYQSQGSLAYRQSNLSIHGNHHEAPQRCCHVLSTMLDTSLVKDPVFMLVAMSNFFAFIALYIPFVYLVDQAVKEGISAQDGTLLISVIGITNTIGRIVCGWIADFPAVNSLLLTNCSLVLAALSTGYIPFCHSYTALFVISVTFGVSISIFISLTSIVLVDLLGLDKLTNAFGLLILFRGLASLFGTPVAGMVYDATHTYTYTFYMTAACFLVSAVLSFCVPLWRSCSKVEAKQAGGVPLQSIEEGIEE